MKATSVAKFFDEMRRYEIPYSIVEIEGSTFRIQFGAHGAGDDLDRTGTFLEAYVIEDSVCEEVLAEDIFFYLDDAFIHKYDSPYQAQDSPDKEVMYIIEIKNED